MTGNPQRLRITGLADLGELKSITVQRNDEGNAPDWFLDRVQVRSKRYNASRRAVFNRWIGTSPSTERFI